MQIIDKSNSLLVSDCPRVSVLSEGQREGRLGEQDCMLFSWQCTSPQSLPVHLITLYTKFPSFLFLHVNRFGPLVRSWCMRYEAKHHYFKRLAIVIGNLSMYHTCWQKDTKRGFVIGYNLQKVVQVHLLTKGLKLVQVKNVCL